eukprot:TRINITY_DN68156_c4_g3_i1.p1 TRINITY_DN68156_c4_g3~~TRINITY_DN68156_c4_g3_i1.p1  ORF type:complete len:147 (-),score=10.94 TRINITY_DN68156_c4_g3_i1:302-742(-)
MSKKAVQLATTFVDNKIANITKTVTPFQRRVYIATSLVPKGKVTTYKALGQLLSCGSAQAIGQALRNNPFAPEVPCHRVVSAALHLGGFHGHSSGEFIDRKRKMLEEEGVEIETKGKRKKTGEDAKHAVGKESVVGLAEYSGMLPQ